MKARTVSLLIIGVVVLAGLATVVIPRLRDTSNGTSAYCQTLSAKREAVANVLGSGDPTALVENLALFQSLAANAPADISASWTALNTAIASLKSAIEATGHKPTEFENKQVPAGLTAAQRQAVVAAADTLSAPITVSASAAIDQEVRDVCQIDLGM